MNNGEQRARILAVEDSATQAALLHAILEAEGYEVEVAGDGEEALALYRDGAFDLVISDVVMPGMSGFDLCRALKEDTASPPPVLLVTRLDEPVNMLNGLAAGADNYVTKPYDPVQLVRRVGSILSSWGSFRRRIGTGNFDFAYLGHTYRLPRDAERVLGFLLPLLESLTSSRELPDGDGMETAEVPQPTAREAPTRTGPLRVLLVEDSATQAMAARILLEDNGMRVETARTAAEAMELFSASAFDLILLDVVLPDRSGFDVCRAIRESSVGGDVPVVLITSLDDPVNVIRGLECGATNFVVKPYQGDQLLSRIREAQNRRAEAEVSAGEEIETSFRGQTFAIRADRARIVDYLVSTFEDMMRSREELQKATIAARTAQESRRFIQSALDALSARIAILDSEGTVVAVNEGWRAFGDDGSSVGVSSATGTNYLSMCDDAAREGDDIAGAVAQGIRQVMSSERDILYQEYPHHSEEDERWFSTRVTRFRDGEPVFVVVAHENITERRLAAESLRQSQARLEEAVRIARLGHWSWTIATGELWWSEEHYRVFGREPGTFRPTYEAFMECLHPDDRASVAEAIRATVEEGAPFRENYRVLQPDGSLRIALAVGEAERDTDGRVTRMLGNVQDVTDERLAEEALQRSEEEYRDLVEHAAYGIYRSTPDGRIVRANSAMARILGYDSAQELISTVSMYDLYRNSAERQAILDDFDRLGANDHLDATWKRRDGAVVHVRLSGQALRDGDGDVEAYDMVAEDVTEARLLEEQLAHTQRMEAVGRLAGGVAHDFNNILTVILSETQMALRDISDSDPAAETLEEIQHAARRAAGLTRQLLAFSRKQIVEPTVFDVNDVVQTMEKMVSRLIGEDVHLKTTLSTEPVPVFADRGQFEQVLANLVVNARDAMPKGGHLTIETASVTLDEDFVQGNQGATAGEFVLLRVTDDGDGMSDDVLAHIFEPFFTTKPLGQGTGLGLATVFGIVKKAGGYVRVESALGEGATFGIYVPKVEEASEAKASAPTESSSAEGSETILLVEDEEAVRRVAERILTRQGYTVIGAGSGEEALEHLAESEEAFDLLLTDVVLPGMGGREVAERVRELLPGIRVLFFSGYTDDVILQRQLIDRHAELLHKPFTYESLADKVREVLDAPPLEPRES